MPYFNRIVPSWLR